MEEVLRKLTLQMPPQGMRERVLAGARAELERTHTPKSVSLGRRWKSSAFWYLSTAAVIIIGTVASLIVFGIIGARPEKPAEPPIAGQYDRASAGFVPTLDTIIKDADAIAVVEVLEAALSNPAAPTKNQYVFQAAAKLKILRVFSALPKDVIAPGAVVNLDYESASATHQINRTYPDFSKGNVCLVALRKPPPGTSIWTVAGKDWENITCRRDPPPDHLPITTKVEFTAAEIAATLVFGSYKQAAAAAMGHLPMGPDFRNALTSMVVALNPNTDQWLQVGVILYSRMGAHTPLANYMDPEWLSVHGKNAYSKLISLAFHSTGQEKLDERVIRTLILNLPFNEWAAGNTLSRNYSTHPLTIKLLKARLNQHVAGTLSVATRLNLDKEHPLLEAAMDDALVRLAGDIPDPAAWREPEAREQSSDFRTACHLIHKLGTDEQFNKLVREFEKCRKGDRNKYKTIWEETMFPQDERLIPLIRIAIEDNGAYGKGRFSVSAAWALQKVTGEYFGIDPNDKTESTRKRAVKKARAWLKKHPAK